MNKILYIKDYCLFLFDNGNIKKIHDNVQMSLKNNNKYLIFKSNDGIFVFGSDKIEKLNIDQKLLIYNLSFAIDSSKKIVFSDGTNIYSLKNSIIYSISGHDELIEKLDWLDNNNILLTLEEYDNPYFVYERLKISAEKTIEYKRKNGNYIIRDKYIYFYDRFGIYICEKLTGKIITYFNFPIVSFDISYDEKLAVFSTKDKIIILNVETQTPQKEIYIDNVIDINLSFDKKYLLIKKRENDFYAAIKIVDINTETIIDFIFNVDFICWII
ncbi:MAG: hypothetical protein QW478_01200 [Candidatus Micrarchaeaceae archaeon]